MKSEKLKFLSVSLNEMLGTFITATTIVVALFVFFGAANDFRSMLSNIPFIQRKKFSEEEKTSLAKYLKDDGYYKNLSADGKKKFMDRLVRFMINKEFVGREGLLVTDEMKVEISASAIRLTFGLEHFMLPNFDKIWIYPDVFVFGLNRLRMKGGTTPGGRIMLSWKDFLAGNANPNDRINLGLHEFAHALKIEVADNDEFDERFTGYFAEWEKAGNTEMVKMRSKKSNVLRAYASSNIHEFFSVAIEHFFERPAEFKSSLPELYNHFVWLLNQDPLNYKNDYQRTIPVKVISPAENIGAKDRWHWSLNMLLTGIFVGAPSLIYFSSQNVVSFVDIFLLITLFTVINTFSWPYFKERRILSKFQFAFFCLFGVGIWGTSLLLLLNCQLPIGKTTTETFTVKNVETNVYGENTLVRYDFTNMEYKGEPALRTFYVEDSHAYKGDQLTIYFQRGLFGIKAFKKTEVNKKIIQ